MGNAAQDGEAAVPAYFVAGMRSAEARICDEPAMLGVVADRSDARPAGSAGEATADVPVDDDRWHVPPSLAVMLQPLSTLRRPTGSLYRLYTEAQPSADATATSYRYGPHRISIGGAHAHLLISPALSI